MIIMARAIHSTIWIILPALIVFTTQIHGELIMMDFMVLIAHLDITPFLAHLTVDLDLVMDGTEALITSSVLLAIGVYMAHPTTIIIGVYILITTLTIGVVGITVAEDIMDQ